MQEINFLPPGLIPEFNAWGRHPESMPIHMQQQMYPCFERLGLLENYGTMEQIILHAINELAVRPQTFTGYYEPSIVTSRIFSEFQKNFVRTDKCNFEGIKNYALALELLDQGHNVVMIENHMSPVDAFVPFVLAKREFGNDVKLPAVIMSQVFEYSRMISLISSCIRKYSVFQPKHMRKMAAESGDIPVEEMKRQNAVTFESIHKNACKGSEMILLYPERDRNPLQMGVPEPRSMKILKLLASLQPKLYILPTFISGLESIYPNNPGPYELDNFFENVQTGQGNFYCGRPVNFTEVLEDLGKISKETKNEWTRLVFGELPEKDEALDNAILSIYLLKMIADIAPDKQPAGVYATL